MIISCNLISDVGLKRSNNEDMVLLNGKFYRDSSFQDTLTLNDNTRMAAIIADGMGGHNGGEFASELAVQSFQEFVKNLPIVSNPDILQEKIKSWVTDAQFMIKNKGKEMPELNGMGTTCVGLLFFNGFTIWLNIGDSRLYRFRDGILHQLSTDHSLREREKDPTIPGNIIYNALGVGNSTFADTADISSELLVGDKYIICSDGLSDMISDDKIEEIINNGGSALELVNAAKKAGGYDNVSVLVVEIIEKSKKVKG